MARITVGSENDAPIEIHYEDHGQGRPDRSDPWVSVGWQLVGTPGAGAARERISSDHVRPSRLRSVESADHRLRLRHVRSRPERAARAPRPERRGPRRFLDGNRRSHALPREVWLGPSAQGRAARRHPALPAQDRRQPRGRRRQGLRRHQVRDRRRPLCLLRGFLQQLLQRRCPRRHPDQRSRVAGKLQCRGRLLALRDLCVRRHLADRLPRRPAEYRCPVLVVHGTDDRTLPFEATAARLPALIADCTLVAVEGGPHNIGWTFPDEVNAALLAFIKEST